MMRDFSRVGSVRSRSAWLLVAAVVWFSCWLVPETGFAQQRPEVGYVYPPGGQVGTVVEARLGGYDWTPDTQFFVLDDRVKMEVLGPPGEMLHPGPPHWFGPKARNRPFPVPREVPVRFTLPADLAPGVIRWQAANANGATSLGEFAVGQDTEVLESLIGSEPTRLPALPVTVSGRLEKKEEIDRYEFQATRTGPVSLAFQTHRFGHPFHPLVQIHDEAGNLLADAADTVGRGLALTFSASAGKTYRMTLHDVDYAGNRALVYRFRVWEGPRVVAAIPPAAALGEQRTVRFVGYGVATGAPRLEVTESEVVFPERTGDSSWSYRLDTPFGQAAPISLHVSDLPQHLETKLREAPEHVLTPPFALTGTLAERDERDQYTFEARQGDTWTVDVESERFGWPLDVAYQILDAQDKPLAAGDDTAESVDAQGTFRVPADGTYRIVVHDLSGNAGSADAIYRLRMSQPAADFSLQLPESLSVPLGGQATLAVKVARQGEFEDAIRLRFRGLPEGVTVPDDVEIPAKKNEVKIPVACAETATSLASLVAVSAEVGGDGSQGVRPSREGRLLVAPFMKPRAVVAPLYRDAGRTVHRGATYAAPVVIERLEGYEGEVTLQLAAHPDRIRQGIRGDDVVVPPGVTDIDFPLFLPEWVQTDRTSRIILNTVVRHPDPRGNIRWLVNKMEQRITMNVEGALLKVTAPLSELTARPGEAIEIPLSISRSPKLTGTTRLELVAAEDGGLQAEALELAPGETRATLRVVCEAMPAGGERQLTIRATVRPQSHLPVISETSVILLTPSGDKGR